MRIHLSSSILITTKLERVVFRSILNGPMLYDFVCANLKEIEKIHIILRIFYVWIILCKNIYCKVSDHMI